MKTVLVVNIPVHAYIEAYVEVPEECGEEEAHALIAKAVEHGRFRPKDAKTNADDYEIDQLAIDEGWAFEWRDP